MKEKSIKKNYVLNLAYEIFALLVPVFVMPYVSRVLGANGVGVYSYTYSIVYYFMLLGALGFTTYARRELSKVRDNKEKKYKLFWEVTKTKVITCVISAILYEIVILIFFFNTYYFVFLQSIIIYLLGTSFDIIYYYQAQEDFERIVYRNILIKIIGVILIFVFVKSSNDLYLYIVIQAIIFVLGNILLWLTLPKDIFMIKSKLNLKKHIKPALKLLIPTVASSIYTILDKTLIGILVTETTIINDQVVRVSDIEVGVYEQVEKLVKMAATILTSLSVIVSPRNSYYFAKKQFDKIKNITYKTYSYVMMISLPMIFGIFTISKYFCPMFLGPGYDKAPYLMNILAVLILFIGASCVFGMQYLTAIGEDTKYIVAVSLGAVTNLVLNFILIPYLYSYGAAIATVVAEFIILIFLIYFARRIIDIKVFIKTLFKYLFGSLLMYIVAILINYSDPTLTLVVRVLVSISTYGLYLILIKDHILIEVTKSIMKFFKKGDESYNEF